MATVKLSYKQDPETLYKFLSDPATARARSEAFGERDIQVTEVGGVVTNKRMVEAEVPSFAKKFLTPMNLVTEVKRWNAATKTAELTVDIQGAPVKLTGTIRITPSGTGSEYTTDFTATCKIPLIGGQLEKHINGVTEQGMRREYEWNQARLNAL